MRVVNKSKRTVLSHDLTTSDSLKKKMIGLLNKNYTAFYLKTHFGIHTMGMKECIDVLILNKKHKVVVIKENLKSWSLFFWNIKYEDVLELPAGTIKKTKTELGDVIDIS